MTIESATYIDGLNAAYPDTGDNPNEGDNHVRLIKSTIKATFPNLTGAVTSSQAELNILDGVTASKDELNVLDGIPATLTATELGYVDGVTGPIQDQFTAKQPVNVFAVGGATTLSAARFQVYVVTGGDDVTLPASPSVGDIVIVIAVAASSNLLRSGSQAINNAATSYAITGIGATYRGCFAVYASTNQWYATKFSE